jgi:hypothetical protein
VLVTRHPAETGAGEAYTTDVARANLRLVLLEAVMWASARANPSEPARCLRSQALAPYVFNDSRRRTVSGVAVDRHRQLKAEGRVLGLGGQWDDLVDVDALGLGDVKPLIATGRLLVWERDTTIDDGAGQAETGGYLDESDMPPWDTWVTYVGRRDQGAVAGCLVSWVPEPFVEAVGRAIEVNAYGALYWLRESKLRLAQILGAEGLLG